MGESDGGLKNAMSVLWGSVLWVFVVVFAVLTPPAPSPKQLWTQIWICELAEHIHCSFLLLYHQVLFYAKQISHLWVRDEGVMCVMATDRF